MRKNIVIIGILFFSLFTQSCSTSPSVEVQKSLIADGTIKVGMNLSEVDKLFGSASTEVWWPLSTTEKYVYFIPSTQTAFSAEVIPNSKKSNRCPLTCWSAVRMENYKITKIWDDPIAMLNHYQKLAVNPNDKINLMAVKKRITYRVNNETPTSSSQLTTSTPDINFTIDDKKEQCKAIGFEPATEKFADCVLRLVELDVKTQQTNQIALAQSQGNLQVANQLKKQRNDQSSQYFLDLGEKLLNPQSTVSAPSTSTCRVTGGVYKTVSCW
tara:strand:+ start:136 stop:945 length:810 start_codon:yes stop_codon:yes gene_type:complete